jgi:hypothetical protein
MTHEELKELLLEKGFDSGWALSGETLILWQHDIDPPAPLVRPHETPSAD